MSYDASLFADVCERMFLPSPRSLRSVCQDEDMPSIATVMRWLADPMNEAAREQYARAMDQRADAMFEEMIDIADTPVDAIRTKEGPDGVETWQEDALGHRKLQVETRKWALGRMSPKKYGTDKIDVTSGGEGLKSSSTETAARIAGLLAEAEARRKREEGIDNGEG